MTVMPTREDTPPTVEGSPFTLASWHSNQSARLNLSSELVHDFSSRKRHLSASSEERYSSDDEDTTIYVDSPSMQDQVKTEVPGTDKERNENLPSDLPEQSVSHENEKQPCSPNSDSSSSSIESHTTGRISISGSHFSSLAASIAWTTTIASHHTPPSAHPSGAALVDLQRSSLEANNNNGRSPSPISSPDNKYSSDRKFSPLARFNSGTSAFTSPSSLSSIPLNVPDTCRRTSNTSPMSTPFPLHVSTGRMGTPRSGRY